MEGSCTLVLGNTWRNVLARLACLGIFLIFFLKPNFELIKLDGDSMSPTILDGEVILVYTAAYRYDTPRVDDIIIIRDHHTGEKLIKRIIGKPGDVIGMYDGYLTVNNIIVNPELGRTMDYGFMDITHILEPDHFFYIGDNRFDSVFGKVSRIEIRGKIILR